MSRVEIAAWVVSAKAFDDEDDLGSTTRPSTTNTNSDETNWEELLEIAERAVLSSKTKGRTAFINEKLHALATRGELEASQTDQLIDILVLTYPRYIDSASRDAVVSVLDALVRKDEAASTSRKHGTADKILKWMGHEVQDVNKLSGAYATADKFVLLSWCCMLYTTLLDCVDGFIKTPEWVALIQLFALILDSVLDRSSPARPSVRRGALVHARRAIRNNPASITPALESAISLGNKSSHPSRYASFIGLIVDVSIRLKPNKKQTIDGKAAVVGFKEPILAYFVEHLLNSKTTLDSHSVEALNDFIGEFVTADYFEKLVLPAAEKSLARTTLASLVATSAFIRSYSSPLSGDAAVRLINPTLNASKSSDTLIRSSSVALFSTLISKLSNEDDVVRSVAEILALLKAGKTTGPDHRIALYDLLASTKPSEKVSSQIVSTTLPLLVKESNDTVIAAIEQAIACHFAHLISNGSVIPPDVLTLLSKELSTLKTSIRRALSSIVGEALWAPATDAAPAVVTCLDTLGKAVAPALQLYLKTVSGTPLNPPAGPKEGFIAVAVLLKWRSLPCFKDIVDKNAVIQAIPVPSTKPSFVFWDKVYSKLSDVADEVWLVRALQSANVVFQKQLGGLEALRLLAGSAYLHVIAASNHLKSRNEALDSIRWLTDQQPESTHAVLLASLSAHLRQETTEITEDEVKEIRASRIANVLSAASTFSEGVAAPVRESVLEKWLVVAHHSNASTTPRQTWIEMLRRASIDPRALVTGHLDSLLAIAWEATHDSKFSDAAYTAITSLAFVAPDAAVERLVQQAKEDLRVDDVETLTDTDLSIWKTPEGTLFVDVLAAKKEAAEAAAASKKTKGSGVDKWEADLRKSLESKKAKQANGAATPLSKEDRALVEAQQAKESEIRRRVTSTHQRIEQGLGIVSALVAAEVEQFRVHIASLANVLLEGVLPRSGPLIGSQGYETYLDLSKCCAHRLPGLNTWVGVATLRGFEIPLSEELQEEPLANLLQRVIYRLRSLSETSPFDPPTYSYVSPLVNQIIRNGGIGVTDTEAVLEQVTIALNIMDFHAGECHELAYPRQDIAQGLIFALTKYSKLYREAANSLLSLGQAIHLNATPSDMQVFIAGTLAAEVYARNACLQAMQPFDLTDLDWAPEIWLACHDPDEQNTRLAVELWEENAFDVPESFADDLLSFLGHNHAYVRQCAPAAIAAAVEAHPSQCGPVLRRLRSLFKEKTKSLKPQYDEFGLLIEDKRPDEWQARIAIARTFESLAPRMPVDDVVPFFTFLIAEKALGDAHPEVRSAVLEAGIAVVDERGSKCLPALVATFEAYLKKTSVADDKIKEAVVILYGRTAGHLGKSDPRVKGIVDRLTASLKTPSEVVQSAVTDCIAPLVVRTKSDAPKLVSRLMKELVESPKLVERRGAAHGLAGVVKGLGLASLQKFDIIGKLSSSLDDKKFVESRQGALFAIERLCATLGRLFEPYVIELLPLLLTTFGDASSEVRQALSDASKVMMANLSGYGVKLILPKILEGLDDKQWRAKKGSVELLGSMAFCAPRQLSVSLTTVVPRLTDVMKDSHAQVRQSASKSLKQFSEVVSNPEIRELAPILQRALVEGDKTMDALRALLATTFVHFVDSPSLAIVVPILESGLKSRSADSKRMAVQIVGNLASLTDSKDFVPHLGLLMPLVHQVLVDPVPAVRAAAAKSLGTLVERLGESTFPEVVPGLLQTLKSEASAQDRQGAAQGLSEILAGLGMDRMENILPQIIESVHSPRPFVREGFMSLLVFLPITFGQRFTPYLGRVVQPILDGLADSEELVRTASMKAGRIVINNFSNKAMDLLLPQLEKSMFDESWRIRLSSITLVGELLYKLSGISGKIDTEEEEETEAIVGEPSRKVLVEILGRERRDQVLAVLFIARQDPVSSVRLASVHIWKALVNNTPRTVRDILPALIKEITELLATSGSDQQETAAATMAELCRKFGEKVLGEIVALLRTNSQSQSSQTREGACLAICEVIENATEEIMEDHETTIISIVRSSLVDDSAKVRAAAATAFDALQKNIGTKAIDQTIPTLLGALRQVGPGSETALQALKEVMTVRANSVFPVLIPTLITTPMSAFNARALAQLVVVSGDALAKRLGQILQALVSSMETETNDDIREAVDEAVRALLSSVADDEALRNLMTTLLDWTKHHTPQRRSSGLALFGIFCEVADIDFSDYRIDWTRTLVLALDDKYDDVVNAAIGSIDAFVKTMEKEDMEGVVVTLRKTIEQTGGPGQHVPGFNAKGLAPMVQIILAGLTGGNSDQREAAAFAIGDIVERTEEVAIKPFTTQLTGPLIRVITQATTLPPGVKGAILSALTTMLDVIPTFVKPFFPQLQRTFCKSLVDPASANVRNRAANALGSLFKSQPRVDPLIAELATSVRSSEDDAVLASIYIGLANVVRSAQSHLGAPSRHTLAELIEEAYSGPTDDAVVSAAADLFTSLAFDPESLSDVVHNHLVVGKPVHPLTSRILAEAVTNTPRLFYDLRCVVPMVRQVVASVGSDESSISRPAREAREFVKTQPPFVNDSSVQALF